MLKTFILGADALRPEEVLGRKELFPNIEKLIDKGASCAYSAYAQRGYECSYLSETNWATIYTGLEPEEHRIAYPVKAGRDFVVKMNQFEGLQPFWKVLNDNQISVGLWAADDCDYPVEVDGYVVSANWRGIEEPQENRCASRNIQVCEKDLFIKDIVKETPPPRLYPKLLSTQGYQYEELKNDEEIAWTAVQKYHFQDSIENFRQELEYYFQAMKRVQMVRPVDVLYFYTPTTDLIAHGCMYCDNNEVLLQAYQVLDEYVGKIMEEFQPDNMVVMSDHGMVNFSELINCSDREVQKEAFASRDEVLWLKNGYIAFEGHNGSLLFSSHAIKGTFIAAGKNIKKNILNEMRIIDIYPTLLELMNCKIPEKRNGYVMDIFNKNICNKGRVLHDSDIKYENIAIIQTHEPWIMDIIINEIYREKRFSKITIIGDERYREIFEGNQRVEKFVGYREFLITDYNSVYCGLYNPNTKKINHMKIK